jgi:signal transduction histidine kinase/CheY-like chemotaxis protein
VTRSFFDDEPQAGPIERLWARVLVHVDRVLPQSAMAGPDHLLAGRVFVVTAAVACIGSIAFSVAQMLSGVFTVAFAHGFTALFELTLFAIMRRTNSVRGVGHALVVVTMLQIAFVSVLLGGVTITALMFIGVVPLIALIVISARAAWGWLAVGLALVGLLLVLEYVGVTFPPRPPQARLVDGLSITILSVVTLAFASTFIGLSRRTLDALRRANHELSLAKARAEAASTAKDRFVATVSHELRTPLSGAIGFARLLVDADLPMSAHENARLALSSSETLLRLVDDILDYAKLGAGQLKLEPVPIDLPALVSEVGRVCSMSFPNGAALHVHVDVQEPLVKGDALRVKQVLMNLVGNALKFAPEGTVQLRVSTDDDGRTRFTIEDTGIGISEETLARLFQPFSQGDSSSTRGYGGTGLGLSISRQLVELMGGTIDVQSRVGQGSTFSFVLPLPLTSERPQARNPHDDAGIGARLRALIIDDDGTNRLLTREYLERMGFHTRAVESGKAGLRVFTEEPWDMVFLDCQMPGMDGYDTARRMRAAQSADTRPFIIALTASALPEERARCLAAGMDDLLTKPFTPSDVASSIARLRLRPRTP